MALPAPTPPNKRVFTPYKQMLFSALYTYVRKLHLWHTKRKTVKGEINNCLTKT